MRKLFYSLALVILSQVSFGQAVKDNAVIPVSITLNSILRLTVTSGGNIEFIVNSIDQYTSGIANADRYTTKFKVSSSRTFDVTMGAEDATFIGMETGGTMALDHLQYLMPAGSGVPAAATGLRPLVALFDGLGASTAHLIVDDSPAGGELPYEIRWALGTVNFLLDNNIPADIYVTNVFLNLIPQN